MLTKEELQKVSPEDLGKELEKARVELTKKSLQVKTGQSKASHEIRKWKKYAARLLTKMNMDRRKNLEKTKK